MNFNVADISGSGWLFPTNSNLFLKGCNLKVLLFIQSAFFPYNTQLIYFICILLDFCFLLQQHMFFFAKIAYFFQRKTQT